MHKDINVNVSGPIQPTSTYKTVVLKGQAPFAAQVTEPNTKYVIKHNFDLGGESVTIPENCVLEFDGGSLSNGNLILNKTYFDKEPLLKVTLEGVCTNRELFIEWFGVKSGVDNGNTTENNSAFSNYILPSLQKLNVSTINNRTINHIVLSCKESTSIVFSQPIIFTGSYDLNLRGEFYYDGSIDSTAITIGVDEYVSFDKNIYIGHLTSYSATTKMAQYYDAQISHDYTGILIKNLQKSKIEIKYCTYFVYNVKLCGHGKGFDSNIIYLENLGGSFHAGLSLLSDDIDSDNRGWITENVVIGMNSVPLKNNNPFRNNGLSVGVIINASGHFSANNNVFIKPRLENNNIGFKFYHTSTTNVISARLENVTTPYIEEGSCSGNHIDAGYLEDKDRNPQAITLGYSNELSNNMCTLIDKDVLLDDYYNDYELCSFANGAPKIGASTSNIHYAGVVVDITSENNAIWFHTKPATNIRIYILSEQQNNGSIQLDQNIDYYVTSGSDLVIDGKVIKTSDKREYLNISFDFSHVKRVFIGTTKVTNGTTLNKFTLKGIGVNLRHSIETDTISKKSIVNIPCTLVTGSASLNYIEGYTLDLMENVHIGTNHNTLPNGVTINCNGGVIKGNDGWELNIGGAKVLPTFNALVDNTNLTITGMPAAGTFYWQDGKLTISNGTKWITADGASYNIPRIGAYGARPTSSNYIIPIGFQYICNNKYIDISTEGMPVTTESGKYMSITYIGNNVWLDPLGRNM